MTVTPLACSISTCCVGAFAGVDEYKLIVPLAVFGFILSWVPTCSIIELFKLFFKKTNELKVDAPFTFTWLLNVVKVAVDVSLFV